MKKISNEVKVGVTAILTILVFIWLYNFLKGKDLFSRVAHYYAVYDNVSGLAESSPVEVNGYRVGVVQSIRFLSAESGKLLVVLSVESGFKLPVNTIAEITTASLIAGMKIQLIYGDGPGRYSAGDTIPGRLAKSLISKVETELYPVRDKAMELLGVLDSVVGSINEVMDKEFRKDLKSGVASLSNTAKSIDGANLENSLDNINKFTAMLAENTGKLTSTFNNLEMVTDTLAAADLFNSVNNLSSTLERTATLLENLNQGKGTAGQLITNDSLYANLSGSLESLNLLLKDMKANPKRYVHFSLFGKKNIPAE